MFFFKTVDKTVRDIAIKIDAAKKEPVPADKVEMLLAARDTSHEKFLKLERRIGDVGFASFLGIFPGGGMMVAGMTGFLAAPSLAAVTGVLLATPLFVAGLGIAAISGGIMLAAGKALDRLRDSRDIIENQVHSDVLKLATAAPKEASKSPRFLRSLASVYNASAENNGAYEGLMARVSHRKWPRAPAAAA